MAKYQDSKTITTEQVEIFEATQPLLSAMADELRKFALKKPDATLSKAKVTFINRLLIDVKSILTEEPNIKYLDLLTDDELPQYSDAVLIISQYEAAMKAFKFRYYAYSSHTQSTEWRIDESEDIEDEEIEDDEEEETNE
jgi:hypothetical protein